MSKAPTRFAHLLLCLGVAACGSNTARPLANGLTVRVADAALAGGAPDVALQVAREILAKHPRNVAALVSEGDALYALGHAQEAAGSYQGALALDARNVPAQLGLGRIRLEPIRPVLKRSFFACWRSMRRMPPR